MSAGNFHHPTFLRTKIPEPLSNVADEMAQKPCSEELDRTKIKRMAFLFQIF